MLINCTLFSLYLKLCLIKLPVVYQNQRQTIVQSAFHFYVALRVVSAFPEMVALCAFGFQILMSLALITISRAALMKNRNSPD